jgi:hypothetical protein
MQKTNFNKKKIDDNKKHIKTKSPSKKEVQKKEIIKEENSSSSYDENEYLSQIAENFTFLKFFAEERNEFEIIFNKEKFKIKKEQLYDCLDFFITCESLFNFKSKMLQKEYLLLNKEKDIYPQNNTGYYAFQVYNQFLDKNNSFWSKENLKHDKDDIYNNLFCLKLKLSIVKKGVEMHQNSKDGKLKKLLLNLEQYCINKLLNNNIYDEFSQVNPKQIDTEVKRTKSETKKI